MEEDITSLQQRLDQVMEEYGETGHPLVADVQRFGQTAVSALKRQQKLIRISDTMQARLYEQRQELDRLNEQKSLFFSIIAHDLRGPFYSLLKYLELLDDPEMDLSGQEKREVVSSLHTTGQRVATLLENLLDWASLNMGTISFQPTEIPLSVAFSQVGASLDEALREKELRLVYPQRAPMVTADREMLSTVLRNLVGNAIKFSHRGGEIRLETQSRGQWVYVRVEDDGVGMDESVRADLFRLGVKTSYLGTEREKGSGVGLILAQEMVARHGGCMEVESAPGQGSVFTFSLPLAMPA